MEEPSSSLDVGRLLELLDSGRYTIECLPSVESTNDRLKERARSGGPECRVVIADRQTAGRGRQQRPWFGAAGLGLYLSVAESIADRPRLVTRWTLGAGVAAAEACRSLTAIPVGLKWPNDLSYDGRKLGGILIEMHRRPDGRSEIFVGVGINVDHHPDDLPAELQDRAVSLRILLGERTPPTREQVAAEFLNRWSKVCDALAGDGWEAIRARWSSLSIWPAGSEVDVFPDGRLDCGESISGRLLGVDDVGALRIESADGAELVITQADSVRLREE
ncbi:MAG: biotin--[acetyl-CoA-carboxylase] ligase [Acidobacteriota bacterium]|nr:biotin--[acetyl-CoA-carboxylase] ligase [Acidobacteriota bacterium]